MPVRGRDLLSGLPKEVVITDAEVRDALSKVIKLIIENIKLTVENTPPELVADLYERGMIITGGGSLLRNLNRLIERDTKIPVHIADEPLTTVVRGTGVVLEDIKSLKHLLLPSSKDQS